MAMGKRQKVAAIGRPSDGVDDGEDCSSSDLDLSSDELSDCDDPPYVLPRAAATGKAKVTAQRKAKAPGKAKATGNRKRTAKGKGSGSAHYPKLVLSTLHRDATVGRDNELALL